MKEGVASLERKEYWKLLLPGEVIREGDQFYEDTSGHEEGWYETQFPGNTVYPNVIYRRKVILK